MSAPPGRDGFCEEFREQEVRIRDDETRTLPWPTMLPGMTPLAEAPAPAALTTALLGSPCPGSDDLWAIPVARLTGHLRGVDEEFVAVRAPSLITLGDGRTAFFAIASEGRYHAADAFGVLGFVAEEPSLSLLFAMPGSGSWGEVGGFSVVQGASAIWSAAGDVSFGQAEGWAGVTDVSGSAPRDLGRFQTYGRRTCLAADASAGAECRGAWEHVITSIAYARDRQLTLSWRLDAYDEQSAGPDAAPRRLRQTSRSLSATYRLDGDSYLRVSGEEPPRID